MGAGGAGTGAVAAASLLERGEGGSQGPATFADPADAQVPDEFDVEQDPERDGPGGMMMKIAKVAKTLEKEQEQSEAGEEDDGQPAAPAAGDMKESVAAAEALLAKSVPIPDVSK